MRKLITSLLVASLTATAWSGSSLNFVNSTDVVNHGTITNSPFDKAYTVAMWVYSTAENAAQTFVRKPSVIISYTAGPGLQNQHGTSSVGAAVTCAVTNLPNYALNKWVFFVFELNCPDNGAVTSDEKIYTGDQTHAVAECTSYGTQRIGSGTCLSTSAVSLGVGNVVVSPSQPWIGNIAFVGVWNRLLSQSELQDQQWNPHVSSGSIVFSYEGFSSGTQPDLSGNGNSGTISGPTAATTGPPISIGGRPL